MKLKTTFIIKVRIVQNKINNDRKKNLFSF